VTHGPFWFHQPSNAQLDELLYEQSRLRLNYDSDVKAGGSHLVDGYRAISETIELGRGRNVFERAVRNAQQWKVHERAGVLVRPVGSQVEQGSSVLLLLRLPVLYVTVACRVVSVSETADSWGFAYGTLPHHVERGEELFEVELTADGMACFKVSAQSRPNHLLTSVGAPFARAVQRRATNRYLKAMVDLVSNSQK
jgi:uncharacterized protein (UPF0548 family)